MELSMRSCKAIPTLVVALALSLPAWGQQPKPQLQPQSGGATVPVQPVDTQATSDGSQGAVPAARGLFVGYEPAANNGAAQIQPDDHLLSGVLSSGLGVVRSFTTLFDPSFFLTESASNALAAGQLYTATSAGGGLSLLRDWQHSRIWAQYFGAETYYLSQPKFNQGYHNFNLSQSIGSGRWNLLVRDALMYTQGANFGNFQTGGIAPSTGVGSDSGFQQGFAAAGTIATGLVGTVNNTASTQVTYLVTRRTSITVSGTYAFLHFVRSGYIDTHTAYGTVGYNYSLSPMNSAAVTYNYSQNGFQGTAATATSHMLQGSFGRKITGKLALQAGAGPQIVQLHDAFGIASAPIPSWFANVALTYAAWPRGVSYSATYFHGLTNGSGVYLGAETDTVGGAVQFGSQRSWSGSISGGYSSSHTLTNTTTASSSYNWFAGAGLNRSLGSQLNFSANYEYNHQGITGVCPVLSCGITPVGQALSGRLEWHPFPPRVS
jgi:hypothetical protein